MSCCHIVVKDEELKIEEIETTHTLGRSGGVSRGEGKGEVVDPTLLSYTLRFINLTEVGVI